MARVTAKVLHDLCRSEGQACWLEEARSKLLLSRVPSGRSKAHELQQKVGVVGGRSVHGPSGA
eukprot:5188057-Prorocentrum_lima.AAC.1